MIFLLVKVVKDCLQLLSGLSYEHKMKPFEGYETVRDIPCKKFLFTTGFTKLQHSKVNQLGIRKDFEAIFVVDLTQSALTKKDIFKKILEQYRYTANEVLVVGDDLHAEIKAAKELGIEMVLHNHNGEQPPVAGQNTIHSFKKIIHYLR